jgi:hypothetical protein
MSASDFTNDLLRMIAAELHFLNGMNAAREMFGKSYMALGSAEKAAVDQLVTGSVAGNFQAITPEFLRSQEPAMPIGFQAPLPASKG